MISASEIEEEAEENKLTVVVNTSHTSGRATVINIVNINPMPAGIPPETIHQIFRHLQAASSTPSLRVAQPPRPPGPPSDQIITIYGAIDPFYNSTIRSIIEVRIMVSAVQIMLANPMLCSSQYLPETLVSLKRLLTLMELAIQAYRHSDLAHSLSRAISIGVEECRRLLEELIRNLTNYRQILSNVVLYFIRKYVWARAGQGSGVHTLESKLRKSHSSFAACLLALGRAAWPELKRGMGEETLEELAKFYVQLEQESTSLRHIKVDAVIVQDHLGRDLYVPIIFCMSSQDFHVMITGFCRGFAGDALIRLGYYRILNSEDDQVINPDEFAIILQPGINVTMSIVFHEQAEERQGSEGYSCPRCKHINSRFTGWVTCGNCTVQFKISPEESSIVSPETQHAGTDFVPDERYLFRKISILQAASFVQVQPDPMISADEQPEGNSIMSPASSFVQARSDSTISADEQPESESIMSPASSFVQARSDPTISTDKHSESGSIMSPAPSFAQTQSDATITTSNERSKPTTSKPPANSNGLNAQNTQGTVAQNETFNIIVCGQAGAGKSSLVNMLDGGRKEVAKTSNDIMGCNFKSEPYNVTAPSGRKFTLWDTAGLDEGPTGRDKASAAIRNIRELIRQLAAPTGLSLIIYVVRAKILSSTKKNYLLFKAFCDSKVPFVLVVTGLDDVSNRAMWWEQNKSYFHRADLLSDGHACIVSSERRRTEKAYVESVKEVFDLIETICPRDPWKADSKSWFIQTIVNVVGVLVASSAKTSERSNVLYCGLVDNGIGEDEAVVAARTLDSAFQPPPSKNSHQVKSTRHSTYDNHHELVSSRSQWSDIESDESSSRHSNQESRMGDISGRANVIIFGQLGSGKSSLVNMIAGRDVARISASTGVECSVSSQSYDVGIPGPLKIKLWDTAGLHESNQGSISSAQAIAAICKLIRDLELDPAGLSLLVYCVRGRIDETTVMNYNMIRSVCHGKIPIALVVTGLEHEDRKKWWEDNQPGFTSRGMDFEHHACVATWKGPKRDGSFVYAKQYAESTKVVQGMIRGACQPK